MRNIVICCDGTSNEYSRDNSNVVRLYQMLDGDVDSQAAFYDPGVGTFASAAALLPVSKRVTRLLGLAIGYGLTSNVEDGYRFLMTQWRPGDQVFLFGFSRGAYAARALAAMVYRCGLLAPGLENLVPYASALASSVAPDSWRVARGFARTFSRPCPIRFLGLWDTVSSIGWAWDPRSLPCTKTNPDVQTVRHAVAIDERRAFFRPNLWGAGVDIKQVWFAGVHCDVGGSYTPERSGLSQIALRWMADEAVSAGLRLDGARSERILSTPPPDHRAPANESLKGWWKLAEYYPKVARRQVTAPDGTVTWETIRRLNLSHLRVVPEGSLIHRSVIARRDDLSTYRPTNLPQMYETVS
jgi:uncharacterized protein (DUF2235 family)